MSEREAETTEETLDEDEPQSLQPLTATPEEVKVHLHRIRYRVWED